jgi:hypothetical protein
MAALPCLGRDSSGLDTLETRESALAARTSGSGGIANGFLGSLSLVFLLPSVVFLTSFAIVFSSRGNRANELNLLLSRATTMRLELEPKWRQSVTQASEPKPVAQVAISSKFKITFPAPSVT